MEGIQETRMNNTTAPTASMLATLFEQSSSKIGAGDSIVAAALPKADTNKGIRYDSKFLRRLRFAPGSTTAPDNLPLIPHVTFPPRPRQWATVQPLVVPQMYASKMGVPQFMRAYCVDMAQPPPHHPFYPQEYPYKRVILKNIHNGIMTVYDTEHPNGSDNYSYL